MELPIEQVDAIRSIQQWRRHWRWRLPLLAVTLVVLIWSSPYSFPLKFILSAGWFGLGLFVYRWLNCYGRVWRGTLVWLLTVAPTIVILSTDADFPEFFIYVAFVFTLSLLLSGVLFVISSRWLKVETP